MGKDKKKNVYKQSRKSDCFEKRDMEEGGRNKKYMFALLIVR